MMIAIPPVHWRSFEFLSLPELALCLRDLAEGVNLKYFLKQPRARPEEKTGFDCRPKPPSCIYSSTFSPSSADTLTGLGG